VEEEESGGKEEKKPGAAREKGNTHPGNREKEG
jgi:hypothetical protein